MFKYIKYYDMGYKEGMSMAIIDSFAHTKKKFKKMNTKELKSLLYDIGYIDGYSIIKKLALNIEKNVV